MGNTNWEVKCTCHSDSISCQITWVFFSVNYTDNSKHSKIIHIIQNVCTSVAISRTDEIYRWSLRITSVQRCTNMLQFNNMTQSHVAVGYVAGMCSACALGISAHIKAPSHRFTVTCHQALISNASQTKRSRQKRESTVDWPGSYVRITYPESTAGSFGSHVPLNRSSSTDHWTHISHPINTHLSPDRSMDLPQTDRVHLSILAPVATYREVWWIAGSQIPIRVSMESSKSHQAGSAPSGKGPRHDESGSEPSDWECDNDRSASKPFAPLGARHTVDEPSNPAVVTDSSCPIVAPAAAAVCPE